MNKNYKLIIIGVTKLLPILKIGIKNFLKTEILLHSVNFYKIGILKFFIIFFIGSISYCETKVKIDLFYYKKVHSFDSGTIHLFLQNLEEKEIYIQKLLFNEEEIKEGEQTDTIYWWTQIPNAIPSGGFGNLLIKLKKIVSFPVRIEMKFNNGDIIKQKFEKNLIPEFFKITSVKFDISKNKVYIYTENKFPFPLKVKKLFVNGKEVTYLSKRHTHFLPFKKDVIVYTPLEVLTPGKFLYLKILTENQSNGEEIITGCFVRIYDYFPLQTFGDDKRKEMNFNPDTFDIHFPQEVEKFEENKKLPHYKVYHLLDDPVCQDEKKGVLGAMVKEVIKRRKECFQKDPLHSTMIYICEYSKPLGYFVYGELADIIAVDPYQLTYYNSPPEENGYFVELAKLASSPRKIIAIPEAFKYITPKFPAGSKRYPTPEEERMVVYSEISAGATGLWYFTSSSKYGYRGNYTLEKEISEINKEIQFSKEYLNIGEPMDIAQSNSQCVKADGILCGDKGVVIILRNGNYKTLFNKEKNEWETKIENPRAFKIFISLDLPFPYWIDTIYNVSSGNELLYESKGSGKIIINVEKMEKIAEVILIKFKEGINEKKNI